MDWDVDPSSTVTSWMEKASTLISTLWCPPAKVTQARLPLRHHPAAGCPVKLALPMQLDPGNSESVR
uniref:Uncharacterized protein n=1 Tax=Anguilla anguilla TaxID=7936 RepID=A0A0E9PMD6_ANGAN